MLEYITQTIVLDVRDTINAIRGDQKANSKEKNLLLRSNKDSITDKILKVNNQMCILADLFSLMTKAHKPMSENMKKLTVPITKSVIHAVSCNTDVDESLFEDFKDMAVPLVKSVLETF